jgi:hypothetical protein
VPISTALAARVLSAHTDAGADGDELASSGTVDPELQP